jgi:hypothetical protein
LTQIMNIPIRWAALFAAWGRAFASRLRRKRPHERQADKTELLDWENEGGNLAPSSEAAHALVTTGSA